MHHVHKVRLYITDDNTVSLPHVGERIMITSILYQYCDICPDPRSHCPKLRGEPAPQTLFTPTQFSPLTGCCFSSDRKHFKFNYFHCDSTLMITFKPLSNFKRKSFIKISFRNVRSSQSPNKRRQVKSVRSIEAPDNIFLLL